MKILVVNCGSSSLKYQFIDMEGEKLLAVGLIERIGIKESRVKHRKIESEEVLINGEIKNHTIAIQYMIEALTSHEHGVINSVSEIDAVGHRVVHAGEYYGESVLIDDDVISALKKCIELAPLHNPANLMGIAAMQEALPNVPMVAVFDTAFHHSMPKKEYIYALPYEYYQKYGVRRYGFHGTSHKYVSLRAAEILCKDIKDLKIVSCHLGSGSSICAIKDGKSIATTMGFTPLEGLPMGTRCGNIDPSILTYIIKKENKTAEEIDHLMNYKSGVLGVSGLSSDFRDLENAASEGNERAELALHIFYAQAKKFIASYAAIMGGIDVLIFTAGIGENDIQTRSMICKEMKFIGIDFDEKANNFRSEERFISTENSKVKILVIPTNEELMIARESKDIVNKSGC